MKTGVHYGRTLIYHAVALGHDLLDHVQELCGGFKGAVPSEKPPFLFYKDVVGTVYHNLGYRVVIHQLLQYVQLPDGIKELGAQSYPVGYFDISGLALSDYEFVDKLLHFVIRYLPGKVDPGADVFVKLLFDLGICIHANLRKSARCFVICNCMMGN